MVELDFGCLCTKSIDQDYGGFDPVVDHTNWDTSIRSNVSNPGIIRIHSSVRGQRATNGKSHEISD